MQSYEYTPEQSAEKLMEFIRDFSVDEDTIEEEKVYVAELFDKLRKSEEFEILAQYLDTMFMNRVFSL